MHKGMSLFCLQALISLLLTLSYPLVSQQESETEIRNQDALQNVQENRLSSSLLPQHNPCGLSEMAPRGGLIKRC